MLWSCVCHGGGASMGCYFCCMLVQRGYNWYWLLKVLIPPSCWLYSSRGCLFFGWMVESSCDWKGHCFPLFELIFTAHLIWWCKCISKSLSSFFFLSGVLLLTFCDGQFAPPPFSMLQGFHAIFVGINHSE